MHYLIVKPSPEFFFSSNTLYKLGGLKIFMNKKDLRRNIGLTISFLKNNLNFKQVSSSVKGRELSVFLYGYNGLYFENLSDIQNLFVEFKDSILGILNIKPPMSRFVIELMIEKYDNNKKRYINAFTVSGPLHEVFQADYNSGYEICLSSLTLPGSIVENGTQMDIEQLKSKLGYTNAFSFFHCVDHIQVDLYLERDNSKKISLKSISELSNIATGIKELAQETLHHHKPLSINLASVWLRHISLD
jgi:hypothetical protein